MSSTSLLNLEDVDKSRKVRCSGQAPTLLLGILIGLGMGLLLMGAPREYAGSVQQAVAMDALADSLPQTNGIQAAGSTQAAPAWPWGPTQQKAAARFPRPSWDPADADVKVEDEEAPEAPSFKAIEEEREEEMKKLDGDWQCHLWDASDIRHADFKDESKQPAICEMHRGKGYDYKFTKGDDKKAPGCDGCWCCRREVDHAAAVKAEEDELLAELADHEKTCLKNNNATETTFKAADPKDKFPCLQAEATKFFKTLETEGKACVTGSQGTACMFADGKNTAEATVDAKEQGAWNGDGKSGQDGKQHSGLKVKKAQYTNPFSVPKEALRRPMSPLPA